MLSRRTVSQQQLSFLYATALVKTTVDTDVDDRLATTATAMIMPISTTPPTAELAAINGVLSSPVPSGGPSPQSEKNHKCLTQLNSTLLLNRLEAQARTKEKSTKTPQNTHTNMPFLYPI